MTGAFVELVAERAAAIVLERVGEELVVASSPYLNVAEAADYLRCDRQRIYDLLHAHRLTKLKDGSRVLVWRAELDDLVDYRPGLIVSLSISRPCSFLIRNSPPP